jgi:hypothetical protein
MFCALQLIELHCIGTAMRYEAQVLRDPIFEDNDPKAWRNQCANPGSTARLGDILNAWKDEYAQLYLIGLPSVYEPKLYTDNYGEEYRVRQIYLIC